MKGPIVHVKVESNSDCSNGLGSSDGEDDSEDIEFAAARSSTSEGTAAESDGDLQRELVEEQFRLQEIETEILSRCQKAMDAGLTTSHGNDAMRQAVLCQPGAQKL